MSKAQYKKKYQVKVETTQVKCKSFYHLIVFQLLLQDCKTVTDALQNASGTQDICVQPISPQHDALSESKTIVEELLFFIKSEPSPKLSNSRTTQ